MIKIIIFFRLKYVADEIDVALLKRSVIEENI